MLLRLKAPAEHASGKQGQQIVYFLWRNSQTARNWVRPGQPQSPDQIITRSLLSAITKNWPTLSDSDRATWQTYATANRVTNRLGVLVTSTALGMYLRCNFWVAISFGIGSIIDTAPTVAGPSGFTGISAIVSTGANSYEPTGTHAHTVTTGLRAVARMAPSVSPATHPQFESLPLISGVVVASTDALEASGTNQNYTAARYSVAAGDDVDLSMAIVDAFGQMSSWFTVKLEVQP